MGRPAITVKYPLAPLAALMGMSEARAMRELGVAGRTAREYRVEGMSELVADRMAQRAGFVAWAVWDGMLEQAERDRRAAVAARRRKSRRKASKAVRQRERDRVAAYRAECREYVLAQQARYRQAHAEEIRAQQARYRDANREAINAKHRDYYARNRDQVLERQRERDGLKRAAKNARRKDDIIRHDFMPYRANIGGTTQNEVAPDQPKHPRAARITDPAREDNGSSQEEAA